MHSLAATKPSQVQESTSTSKPEHRFTRGAWWCLAVAAPLLLIAYGANTVPLAAWLAPVFLLRFVRRQKVALGLAIAYCMLMASFAFQLRGMVPIPGWGYYVFLVVYSLFLTAPYLLDRLLAPRLMGWKAALVFPSAWAATEYLVSLGIYGSWGSAAYSQYGNLPLLQLLSVTGLWGVTFLLGWFATTVNWLWEEGLGSRRALRTGALYTGVLLAVLLGGGLRMALFPPSSQAVRVASISRRTVEPKASDEEWRHLLDNRVTPTELDHIRASADGINRDLLAHAEREMQAGARIVFWGEANAPVLKPDEPTLLARGRELAAKHQAYLGMALATWNQGQQRPLENKIVLIRPDGQIALEYFKAHPVPGGEAAMSITRDGRVGTLDTPYGRVTAVICFDADFPRLLQQAGALGADVVLDPSNDWRAIDPWHTQMASFRAIEEGFSLVRHTSLGLSAAYDYQGRRLAAMDHYRSSDYAMVSQVPTRGARTIYSRLGDWFAWLCIVALLLLLATSRRRSTV